MAVPFDHIASTYDEAFARSAVGQLQRIKVWNYIEKVIPYLNGFEVLELNYGFGEDAILFGDKGFNLVGTDVTTEMLKVSNKKVEQISLQEKIGSHYLDLDSLDEKLFDKKFDLIFSNFGGLNCIYPEALKKLLEQLPNLLNPGGHFIGIVMPRHCAWETFFFLLRLQFGKAFRRWTSNHVVVSHGGIQTKNWFYPPQQIRKWAVNFDSVSIKPVGIALPPSYLDNFLNLGKSWLFRLDKIEKLFHNYSGLASYADHFIVDLQVK